MTSMGAANAQTTGTSDEEIPNVTASVHHHKKKSSNFCLNCLSFFQRYTISLGCSYFFCFFKACILQNN